MCLFALLSYDWLDVLQACGLRCFEGWVGLSVLVLYAVCCFDVVRCVDSGYYCFTCLGFVLVGLF